jgi:toxin-antitoxin system PIN domain toxin
VKVPDVNVLVGAFRDDDPNHLALVQWLESAVAADEPLGVSDSVLAAFVRIVTNRRIFDPPTPLLQALESADDLRRADGVRPVHPGPSFWRLFVRLCQESGVAGPQVADAAHAALAIEHRATFVTLDRDFARFPDLRWESPLATGQAPS